MDLGNDALFTEYMEEWLDSIKHSKAKTTYAGYNLIFKTHIKPFFEAKNLRVKDLTPSHIRQYINNKLEIMSPNTVIKHLRNISKCLDNAVIDNIIAYNPVKRIEMPKQIKYTGAQFYNEKQIRELMKCSEDDPLEIVILLTLVFGLRRSEVLGLKWDAVDMDNNTITIRHTVIETNEGVYRVDSTKNKSSYAVIPMPDMIKKELKRWKAKQLEYKLLQPNDYTNDEGYICTMYTGELIKPNYITQHFRRLLKKYDLPIIRFHDLRHSSASYLKYLGFDLKDIQTWLRHSNISTTIDIYTHLDMDAKTEIANRLNDSFLRFVF